MAGGAAGRPGVDGHARDHRGRRHRERDNARETERETETETDKETDRQTDRQTDREEEDGVAGAEVPSGGW